MTTSSTSSRLPSSINTRVAFFDLQIFMGIERQPRQGRHRFALASAGNDADFVSRIVSNLLRSNDDSRRHLQESELFCRVGIFVHAPSEKTDQTTILFCLIDNELETRDRGGET